MDRANLPDALYVTGPHWHIVDGDTVNGPNVGEVYLFWCYKWMGRSEAIARGLHRGIPSAADPVCGSCLRYGGSGARSSLPVDGDEPQG